MLNPIKALLQDEQLRQQVEATSEMTEVVRLITTAAIEKGYTISKEAICQAFNFETQELAEDDLLAIAGGAFCMRPTDPPGC